MSDNSYLPRQVKVEGSYESGKTVSFAAYDEARQLDKSEFVNDLYKFIENETEDDKKRNAYFIAGNIAKNVSDKNAASFFIDRLKKEKDRQVIETILLRLAELFKPAITDLTPILKLTENRNWHIRGLAYEALTNTEHKVEQFLIDKLKGTDNKDDIQYLIYALKYVGTQNALAAVEPHLKNRKPSIKDSAHTVIALIMIREGFSNDAICKKLKYPESVIDRLRERLPLLTRPG
ncbi:MAG: hypothetical protein J0L56_18880 [Chitinophagales bacterium]|nr:hypothetical protein [Chitinophagales bacterium]